MLWRWNVRDLEFRERAQHVLVISDLILSRHHVYFEYTLRTRVRLLIKVHNLQTDRLSPEIQPHAKSGLLRTYCESERKRECCCLLVLAEYPDISGSHCSLNSRCDPIYRTLSPKIVIRDSNVPIFVSHEKRFSRDRRSHWLEFTYQLTACTASALIT